MAMTMSEKILAKKSGKASVVAGDLVTARPDVIMSNDITTAMSAVILQEHGIERLADPDKLYVVMSHFVPAKDIASARMAKTCREFVEKFAVRHYFEAGQGGIEHALLPDEGYVVPGDLVLGADSHSCTYGGGNTFAGGVRPPPLGAAWGTGGRWLRGPGKIKVVF